MHDRVEKGLAIRVVLALLCALEDQGFHISTDNFYANPDLLCYLFDHWKYGCGTVRMNRKGFVKDFLFVQSKVSLAQDLTGGTRLRKKIGQPGTCGEEGRLVE